MHIFVLCLIFPLLTVSGQSELYQIVLESSAAHVYGPNCDGCEFHLYHEVSPSGTNVTKLDDGSGSDATLKFNLNSTLVIELKSYGITHHVCLIRRVVPTNSNGVDEVEENTLFCRHRPSYTFAEACLNRDQPEMEKIVSLFCPDNIMSICSRAWLKYRIYIETASGEPCPASETRQANRYQLTIETTEEYFHKQHCDDCYIFLQYTVYPSGMFVGKHGYSFPKREDKLKINLDSSSVSNMITNGVSFAICMKIKQRRTHSNGRRVSQDLAPVCHHEWNVTFVEACTNRYRSKKLIQLQYPSEGDEKNVTVWEKYIFYLETEFGKPCPIIDERSRLHWEQTDIYVHGARIGNTSLHTVFVTDTADGKNVLYRIIIEAKELLVYHRVCDGCEFRLDHQVFPDGAKTSTFDTDSSSSDYTLIFTLNSTSVTELKSRGITHDVCLIKRVHPTDSNGVDEVKEENLFCQQELSLAFAQACAHRNHPHAEADVVLHCPLQMSATCYSASVKLRIYVETVSGEPCPSSKVVKLHVYYIIFEKTQEHSNTANFWFRISPSGPTVVTPENVVSSFHTYNTTLDAENVGELKWNGISFKTCYARARTPWGGRRMHFCETQQTLTFAEACANRFRPEAKRYLFLSNPSAQHGNNETISFKYRFYVEMALGKPCLLSEEPFRFNWEVTDIDVTGSCGNCTIRPDIRLGTMSQRTEFIDDTDLDDEQVWDFILHGMNYTELWYLDTHPTELPTDVSYAAHVPGKATVAELCTGVTANRVVPCKPDDTGRNICSEISYILKLSLTTKSGEPCPIDTLRMLQ